MKIKNTLLLFDIDGTMTDTKRYDDKFFIETLEELYNFNLSDIDWSTFEHVTDSGLANEIYRNEKGRPISKTELKKVQRLFLKKWNEAIKSDPHCIVAIPGIRSFINFLKEQNVPVAIATGGWRKTAELKLKRANIEYEPFNLATSNDSPVRRTIMNVAIARAQFEYQTKFLTIVYFGDGIWDAKTCEAMNIPMIGIDYNKTGILREYNVNDIFTDFTEVNKIYRTIVDILSERETE